MHYLNEYYKSHTYESVTLKEKRLNFFKHPLCAPQLCAEFLERIVRTIRGFTVSIFFIFERKMQKFGVSMKGFIELITSEH